ncbi:MAG TPA: S8 family serine peptidase [Pyrinomonadaceae bacterium]|nr:S8 family serine peptidase [Pyrinomonadaceae bacterium]
MKKVFAFLALAVLCAATLPTLVGAQRSGVNPANRVSDAAGNSSSDDRYIIKFRHFTQADADDVRAKGGKVVRELPELSALAARLPERVRQALLNNPNVEFIEADVRRYPMQVNPPWSDLPIVGTNETTPYGIQMVQADQVSDQHASNRKICIIDSGYKDAHEDLMDRTSGRVTASTNAGTGDPYRDIDSHGTHVAGTIAALRNGVGVVGVLPSGNINLHIVKVFGDDGAWAYSSDLASALTQCRNAGANVVSMSLGGPAGSITEQNAFNSAYTAGVLSIAAAGNDGTTATSYPAGYSTVVSVAAVDNTEALGSFSQRNADVEIAAPGVNVLSSISYKPVVSLAAGGTTFAGQPVEYAPANSGVSGQLADGGQCTATGAWAGKVVLCQRGTNSFFEKVTNVQNGGGVAAVIYNNLEEELFATLGEGNTSSITAIGLRQSDGQAALASVGSNGTVTNFLDHTFNDQYAGMNGTSMATPHVSAVAALIWSYNTSWTNQQVRDAMNATALDRGTAGRDTSFGYGIVQAKSALTYLQSPPAGPAAPTNLRVTSTGNTSIGIAWNDNSTNESGFKIERCTGSTCTNFAQIGTVGANATGATNSGLTRRTTYRYRVRAYNAGGDSAYSNIVNATTR